MSKGRPVAMSPDGYFNLNGRKAVVFGAEEEHHRYTKAELGSLIPRLHEMGIQFLVLYKENPQEDFFYGMLEAEGIWVAQDLGNVKRMTRKNPFPNTGGVIGTVPDETTVQDNLSFIRGQVKHLSRFHNILFWWMGGELVEPKFHTQRGIGAVRDSIRLYGEAVRRLDPLKRPFTVSHHYVEAVEHPFLPFIDYSDLTDFSWFTVSTHFHLGDFIPDGGWFPVAKITEHPSVLRFLLRRAYRLNRCRPIFLGGWFASAPTLGSCIAGTQSGLLHKKWGTISNVPYIGGSTYHLAAWDGNEIPHALFEMTGKDWVPTAAGKTLAGIIRSSRARSE